MANLQALTVQYVSGVSSFNVLGGIFYRVDCTGQATVTAQLPAIAATDPTWWNIIKKVDTGTGVVNITPNGAEQINATTVNQLTSHNQSHNLFPGAPASYATGWMTF